MTEPKSLRIVHTEAAIATRVGELARQISDDHRGKELVVIATLNGSYIFFADLLRRLDIPAIAQCIHIASYPSSGGTSGEARVVLDVSIPLEGKHVLVLEGTVVSGRTPQFLFDLLSRRRPASIKFATLILKPETLAVDLPMDYVGFRTDEKLNGYGMSVDGNHYRHLPYLGVLDA